MTRSLRTPAPALAVAASLLAALTLAGCSAEDIGERAAEKAIEQQLGDGAEVDLDTDDGGVTVEDGDGNSYSTGTTVPEDFPDDVPLIEGTVVSAVEVAEGTTSWTVAIATSDTIEDAFATVRSEMESAGFEYIDEVFEGTPTAHMQNGTWRAVVSVIGDPALAEATVSYSVTAYEG